MKYIQVIQDCVGTHNLVIKDSVLEHMFLNWTYVCLQDLYFQHVHVSLSSEKHILQSLSQRIIKYWKIIHKYVKFTMDMTGQNWNNCTQFKKSHSEETLFYTADNFQIKKSLFNYF